MRTHIPRLVVISRSGRIVALVLVGRIFGALVRSAARCPVSPGPRLVLRGPHYHRDKSDLGGIYTARHVERSIRTLCKSE